MMSSKVAGVGHATTSITAQATMGKAMGAATNVLRSSNQTMSIQRTQAQMEAYQKESMKLEMSEEMSKLLLLCPRE